MKRPISRCLRFIRLSAHFGRHDKNSSSLALPGKRQKTKDKRQKTKDKRQKTKDKRQKTNLVFMGIDKMYIYKIGIFLGLLISFGSLTAQFMEKVSAKSGGNISQLEMTSHYPIDGTNYLPTEDQLKYDVKFYDLTFRVDFGTKTLFGTTVINAEAVDSLNLIVLDFYSGNTIEKILFDGVEISSYTQTANNTLEIQTSNYIHRGSPFNLSITYRANPPSAYGDSFTWEHTNAGENVFYTLSEPYGAIDWWPSKNTPTDKPDSVYIRIIVPDGWKTASNGILVSVENTGSDSLLYFWKHRYPISTYLVAIAGAPYVEINDSYTSASGWTMDIQHFIYPEDDNTSTRTYLNNVKDMLHAFDHYYGDYPFKNEKYGIARFKWGGGMEHQTMTYQSGYSTYLSAHELSHQWFGDNVTCADFHHIWLNEGFASFSEAVYAEWGGGKSAYLNYIFNSFYGSAKYTTKTIYVDNISSVGRIFDYSTSYCKGALVVYMLREIIKDDELFFNMLKEWNNPVTGFGDSSATTEDFSDFVSDFTGDDYSWFFEDWIYKAYHPVYKAEWNTDQGNLVSVTITQKQQEINSGYGFFRMPVELKFSNSVDDTTITVFNDQNNQTFNFTLNFTPTEMELDPDKKILRDVDSIVSIGAPIIPKDFSLRGNYPNPFNPSTRIEFTSPAAGKAKVEIFNSTGQLIRVLETGFSSSGLHHVTWNGRDNKDKTGASGNYFYRVTIETLSSAKRSFTGKMQMVR